MQCLETFDQDKAAPFADDNQTKGKNKAFLVNGYKRTGL